jgi:hypothetical protein
MLDTKTLTKETIKECRETEKWLKDFVKKHAPKGTTCSCEELRVNDDEGDEYIFCEVTLTCNKRTHCFNFYAGANGCSLVERLGGEKGEEALGDTYGKAFDMEFDMPSLDDMGDLEDFLERLNKYVPKMPKSAKKDEKHVYLLSTKSRQENGHNGDDFDEDETLFETLEKAQKALAKEAKDAIARVDGINEITMDEQDHTKKSALEALKGGVSSFSMSADIDGDYYYFGAKITEKDIF